MDDGARIGSFPLNSMQTGNKGICECITGTDPIRVDGLNIHKRTAGWIASTPFKSTAPAELLREKKSLLPLTFTYLGS